MEILKGLVKACNTFSICVDMGDTAMDLVRVHSQGQLTRWQKMHRTLADAVFIFAQTGAMRANLSPSMSSDEKLALRTGANGAGILKEVSHFATKNPIDREDLIDFISKVGYRVIQTSSDTIMLKPEWLNAPLRQIESVQDLLNVGALLIKNQQNIRQAYSKAMCNIKYVLTYIKQRQNPDKAFPKMSIRMGEDPVLQIDSVYLNLIKEAQKANKIEDYTSIPELFNNDAILSQFRCGLSKKLIRFIVVVETTEKEPQPICYEKAIIEKYLKERPHQPPENWPNGVVFSLDALRDFVVVQNQINNRLNVLLNEFKTLRAEHYPEDPEENKKKELLQLIKTLDFNEERKTDSEVADLLLASIPNHLARGVSCFKIEHTFEGDHLKKHTRMIFIQTKVNLSAQSSNQRDLYAPMRAIFGSKDPKDLQALVSALKEKQSLKIFISMDLQRIAIE